MAELFWWFEVVKPSFVQPRVVRPQGGNRFLFFFNVEKWEACTYLVILLGRNLFIILG